MINLFSRITQLVQLGHVLPRLGISALVFVPIILHVSGWSTFDFLRELETFAYDARVRYTAPGGVDSRIIIVDLDEKSIIAEGHWPWSRDKMAVLINQLYDEYEIRLLGFDAVFSEADDPSAILLVDSLLEEPSLPEKIRDQLRSQREELQYDQFFAESLIARDLVLGYSFRFQIEEGEVSKSGLLPEPLRQREELTGITVEFPRAKGYVASLPDLQANAMTAGFIDKPLIDHDGITRRAAMLTSFEGDLYASLSLAMAIQLLGNPPLQFVFADSGGDLGGLELEALKLGETSVPVDNRAALLVPYRGPRNSFQYVSATDIINGTADPEVLRNSIAIFGASAAGMLDLHATPVGSAYPGVEVHANVVAGILDSTVRHQPAWARGVEILLLIPIGLLAALALPRLTPLFAFLFLLATAGVLILANLHFWVTFALAVPIASTLMYLLVVALLQLNYSYFIESKNKRRLSRMFSQYIPPEIVDEMDQQHREISVEGENREMSVLFSDVRGFTTISEGLKPTELTQFMNAFLTPITKIIHNNRGTIDKYMGDCVMAFWGAPLRDENHARRSVVAGMAMIARMGQLREEFAARGWPGVRIGVGVSTGPMNVGNMGSKFRVAYTVLGDAVNLGARLEGQTKNYSVEFIVSEATCLAIPDYAFRALDRIKVKGKNEAVAIFEPIGPKVELNIEQKITLSRFNLALMLYHAQKWELADAELVALHEDDGHPVYTMYRERIKHYLANSPGPDWDGVLVATTK